MNGGKMVLELGLGITIPAVLAIIIGIIILIWPKIINYAIALWLIVYGLLGIFG